MIAILVFDEVEVLDFAGPFEVFSVSKAGLNVVTVGTKSEIRARNNLVVRPTLTLADPIEPRVLVIPGGWGTRVEMRNEAVLSWIRANAAKSEIVFSVCTGALLLAAAGLLRDLTATTHHGALEELRQAEPRCQVTDRRIVDNGTIVTAAGISSGIDGAFHILSRLAGMNVAIETAHYMEYPFSPDAMPARGQPAPLAAQGASPQ
ncbi:MAG TPA: DJ-1/PfpI family protein [Gemmatimonadaceae bacterium]|jgi:transcriptional regulator GlxA family with amidase domain|nr:DJ-1/PfpI family protein [Gemmatimonadaceae bacterium]